ncbi:MAG: pyruvate:ferredoxin (flavodoxin) oxidoreductase, partial [Nanobdellota archaeon]
MENKKHTTMDGNTAASNIAYLFSEVAAIYPITPSSPMGEMADLWAAKGRKNLFGEKLNVIEMQSEGGASGAIHGSLTGGALTTTYTASQGLLLMLPNMFKIAGEMLPGVFHVASRSLAYQALSIFGDHSDTMAARGTGFAMLSSGSVQEAQDMAAIAHLSAIESSVPFLHFFDGFRTSHEIQKIENIEEDVLKSMINFDAVKKFKDNGIRPEKPYSKVGAENPDVYFQGRERSNKYYEEAPEIVKKYMDLFYEKTGRRYEPFQYVGDKNADKIIIAMGSSVETIDETVNYLNSKGDKVGAIKVRLYRPFSTEMLIEAIPESVKKIAVLDRTKESGSVGEPLYLDVVSALKQNGKEDIEVIGGRYGLSSKEFTPSMVNSVFDHLENNGVNGFTVGIEDDLSNKSIKVNEDINTENSDVIRCKFWGYGSDGTVSANKNSIKIIGEETDMFVQGYFSYDSKKSGGTTVSHLRFGNKKIKSQYLLEESDFIALHKPSYIGVYDILEGIKKNGTFLINCPWKPEDVIKNLTKEMQDKIKEKNVKVYCIDAFRIANEMGLGNKINTIMQTAFFKLSGVIEENKAIELIKKHIEKQFRRKGKEIVKMNWDAVDNAVNNIKEVPIGNEKNHVDEKKLVPDDVDDFTKSVIEPIMRKKGDNIPVSKMPLDGAVPTGTTKLEKRGVAVKVPKWISEKCIQCGNCSLVCPHAAIRIKQVYPEDLKNAPEDFVTLKSLGKNENKLQFRVQVYPEDCVGCGLCKEVCPKEGALEMIPLEESRKDGENERREFFDKLPENITEGVPEDSIKGTQLKQPLLEFSGACGGCGETPYAKLVTQMFGDNMIIANATGCSSIWGGTFPTIPYTKNKKGKGPAWANSLFEDNAEYGFGMRLAVDSN